MNLLNRFFPKKKDSNKLYTEALEALLEGDIENAVFKLKDLVQYDTNNIRAYLRLGDIFRENLKVEQALKIHQSLILRKRLSKALQCEIYMSLARDFFEFKKFERVQYYILEILKIDKKNINALNFILDIYILQEKWDEGIKILKKIEKFEGFSTSKKQSELIIKKAKESEENKLFNDAIKYYKKSILIDSSNFLSHLKIGNIHEKNKNFNDALVEWKIFAEKSIQDGKQIYNKIEKVLFELGRFGEIEEFYRTLLKINSQNSYALLGLVNVLISKGEFDKCLSLIDDLIPDEKSFLLVELLKIKIHLKKKNEDKLLSIVDNIFTSLKD